MSALSVTFIVKIGLTLVFWCVPLLLFPADLLEAIGLPPQSSWLLVRLLGWAYLALSVGYGFGLHASLQGVRAPGPIWTGIVSNGGACIWLLVFGLAGAWADWGVLARLLLWSSAAATGLITLALVAFGLFGKDGDVAGPAAARDSGPS